MGFIYILCEGTQMVYNFKWQEKDTKKGFQTYLPSKKFKCVAWR